MKIGGYAHSKGITFFCDVLKIKASKNKKQNNTDIKYELEWILPKKWMRRLENKPFLNIVLLLYYQWKIIDKKIKIAFVSLAIILTVDQIYPILFFEKLFNQKYLYSGIALFIILNIKKIITIFRYHGAEHKIINCYMQHGYLDYKLAKDSSRFHKRCGSNLVIIFLLFYALLWFFKVESIIILLVIFFISIQIFMLISTKNFKGEKVFYLLQCITVLEPKEEQLQLAINAFNRLQKAHFLYKASSKK